MKLCIFSDSHGRADLVKKLPLADAYLFCGDGLGDLRELPGAVYAVCGNCDWGSRQPETLLLELGGRRILMTHGHKYRVKFDQYRLALAAREADAGIAVYGHTHIPNRMEDNGLLLLNPGALSGRAATCLLLDTDTMETEWVEMK